MLNQYHTFIFKNTTSYDMLLNKNKILKINILSYIIHVMSMIRENYNNILNLHYIFSYKHL